MEIFSAFFVELPIIKVQAKRIELNLIFKLPYLNYNFALTLRTLISGTCLFHYPHRTVTNMKASASLVTVHMSTNDLYALVFMYFFVHNRDL